MFTFFHLEKGKRNDLKIENLHVSIEKKQIVKNVSMSVEHGKVTVLMGPNGSGKSTIANVLLGNPKYSVEKGRITFKGKDITSLAPEERAKLGLFLSFQHPVEISGVSVANFLRTALNAKKTEKLSVLEFKELLDEKMKLLGIKPEFADRYLNEGFSGGEKKRCEVLQLAVLEPEIAIIDEVDSGLDIESLKKVGEGIMKIKEKTNMGIFIITHYNRILKYIKPDKVYVFMDGEHLVEGDAKLANRIENEGYDFLKKKENLLSIR